MRLRTRILAISIATALPILICAVLTAALFVEGQNANLISAAKTRNRAMLAAVEADLQGAVGMLQALGNALDKESSEQTRQSLARLLATQALMRSVVVVDSDGRRLASTMSSDDSREARAAFQPQLVLEVLNTQRVVIGDLLMPTAAGSAPGIALLVPIVRDGHARFVIGAVLPIEPFQRLFDHQQLPPGWVSGLVDRRGQLIARIPYQPPGNLASDDYLRHVRTAPEGWYRGRTIEGEDTFTAFLQSDLTGWSIGYAVPAQTVLWGAVRSGWLIGGGIVLSTLAAAGIAMRLGRRIDRPVAQLIGSASALGAGAVPAAVESSITEVAHLSQALVGAGETIVARDAQLRQSEDALRRQADELRVADENKSRFLAQLGHELRNPLAVLANTLAILQRGPQPLEQKPALEMMGRQIRHMTHLINDLLDVSRIAQGQLTLHIECVAMQTVVREALEIARPVLDQRGQRVPISEPAELLFVNGDAVRLAEVVANLIHNASKFSPEHSAIEIKLSRDDAEVLLAVRDSGVGFERETALRIFDPFVQLHAPRSGAGAGLGIGLSVVKSLIDLHGGRVAAHSEGPGRGAIFTVRLPRAKEPVADS